MKDTTALIYVYKSTREDLKLLSAYNNKFMIEYLRDLIGSEKEKLNLN